MRVETQRLVLREFSSQDWLEVWRYQSDPAYLRYYPWEARERADARSLVQTFVDWQAEQPRRRWQLAIELQAGDALVGNAGLRRKSASDLEADIGFELAPSHWGHGYATEAAQALLRFGFQELGLHRISSWCIAENEASARVLGRLGLREEGRLRQNEHFKGRYWDTLLFGVLREEWTQQRRG